jgi:hypothetical protein
VRESLSAIAVIGRYLGGPDGTAHRRASQSRGVALCAIGGRYVAAFRDGVHLCGMVTQTEIGRGERVTVVLEPALRQACAHEARRARRSVSNFIRNLIADAVEREARAANGQSSQAA